MNTANYSQYSKENPMHVKEYWHAPKDYVGWVQTNYDSLYHMKNGVIHNENGHAIEETDGEKKWCVEGKLHRLDGPAWERATGEKSWHVRGIPYEKWKFDKHPEVIQYQLQNNPPKPVAELSYKKERKKFLGG